MREMSERGRVTRKWVLGRANLCGCDEVECDDGDAKGPTRRVGGLCCCEVGVNAVSRGIWKASRVKARQDAVMVDVVALKVITVSSGLEVDYGTQSMPFRWE
jgi:hypothetical protein